MQPLNDKDFARARTAARGLALFRDCLADEVGNRFLAFLNEAAQPRCQSPPPGAPTGSPGAGGLSFSPAWEERLFEAYGALLGSLATAAMEGPAQVPAASDSANDAWQVHLRQRIVDSENPFTRLAERAGSAGIPGPLAQIAAADLRRLQLLEALDGERVRAFVARSLPPSLPPPEGEVVGWTGLGPGRAAPQTLRSDPQDAAPAPGGYPVAAFHFGADWGSSVTALADHIQRRGAGVFGRFHFFRWVRRNGEGRLEGVPHPDPTRLDDLIGYDPERAVIIRNAEKLVRGLPSNNVLLYGDRGTGKSATVKALVHHFGGAGLRLVELPKSHLGDLAELLQLLGERGRSFILFIDDLSFEESEGSYKELKALFEGSAAARPANVALHATSNRRHLVRERFSDRAEGPLGTAADELRRADTVQEKLSLADRFGLTVIFPSPDQAAYLDIVAGLAERRGLSVDPADLRRRALRWAAWQNGRSARTARQFIDDLQGELALEAGAATSRAT